MKKIALLALTVSVVVLLVGLKINGLSSHGAQASRIVTKNHWNNEPVEITGVHINGKQVGNDVPFSADDDWMRELSIDVKNISGKNISYMRFELLFPLKDSPRPHYYAEGVEYGEMPGGTGTSQVNKPGETIRLSFSVDVSLLKSKLQEKGDAKYLGLNNAKLSVEQVYFDNSTAWINGLMFRFNEATKKWDEIAQIKQESQIAELAHSSKSGTINTRPSAQCFKPYSVRESCCEDGRFVNLSEPGDNVCVGSSEVDKEYRCSGTPACIIFYTGVDPGCSSC